MTERIEGAYLPCAPVTAMAGLCARIMQSNGAFIAHIPEWMPYSQAGDAIGIRLAVQGQRPHPMQHTISVSRKPFRTPADRFVRRILLPIVLIIALYGLVSYVVTGNYSMGTLDRSIEAPPADR